MKLFIKGITVLFLLFTASFAQAAWFGPSTYEECMNDGKVGRTSGELGLLNKHCQKKFPKLLKLHKLKDAYLTCIGEKSEVVHLKIKKNFVYVDDNKKNFFKYRNSERIVLEPTHTIENFNKKITYDLFFTINTLNGSAYLKPLNTHNEPLPPMFIYSCSEE